MTRRHRDIETGRKVTLALDSSSSCTGWAVFDGEVPFAYGQYKPEGKEHGAKLTHFTAWLMDRYDEYAPDNVVFERPYPGREKHAYGVLQMYVGVIIATHWMHFGAEIPPENRVLAKEVKRLNEIPSGTYEGNKRAAVNIANSVYQLQLKYDPNDKKKQHSHDDIADALLLGRAWFLQGNANG